MSSTPESTTNRTAIMQRGAFASGCMAVTLSGAMMIDLMPDPQGGMTFLATILLLVPLLSIGDTITQESLPYLPRPWLWALARLVASSLLAGLLILSFFLLIAGQKEQALAANTAFLIATAAISLAFTVAAGLTCLARARSGFEPAG